MAAVAELSRARLVMMFLLAVALLVVGLAHAARVSQAAPAGSPAPLAGEPSPIAVGTNPKSVAIAPNGQFAIVSNVNSHTLSRIDVATGTVTATISTGSGSFPKGVAISGDSSSAAVALAGGGVGILNTATNVLTKYNPATPYAPGGVFSGAPKSVVYVGSELFVGNASVPYLTYFTPPENTGKRDLTGIGGSCDLASVPTQGSSFIVTSENTNVINYVYSWNYAIYAINVGSNPCGVAVAPSGAFAYVANMGSNNVSRIDLATRTVTATTAVGTSPTAVAFSPDGALAYVTNMASNTVSRIDTARNTVTATLSVGASPTDIAVVPDGSFAYVTNYSDNTVTRLNLTPAAPMITSLTPGNGTASAAFTAPAANGSEAVSNYQYSTDNGATWTARTPAATTSPLVIPGLANGTAYQVKLRAVNAAGAGAASNVAVVTPRTTPGAPTIVAVTGGVRSASAAFNPPASNGGAAIINYEYSISGGSWTPASPPATGSPVVITGLPDAFAYSLRLRAVNAAGPGVASAPYSSATFPTPAAPTALVATPGDGSASIAFTPGADHGFAITNYRYSTDNGATWKTRSPATATSPLLITGLTNGVAYTVKLRAVNNWGESLDSAAVMVTPAPTGMQFVPMTPARVADTRLAEGGAGPILPGEGGMRVLSVATVQAGGAPAVPVGATAIVVNVTVPNPTSDGHVRIMPGDAALTSASAVNFRAGESIANGLTAKIDAQRRVKVYTGAAADVVLDVVGYFVPATAPASGRFTPLVPVRVYDSVADPLGELPGTSDRQVSTATALSGGATAVPAGATAVAYNITVVRPAGAGHLRVMPGDETTSSSSTINWATGGDVIANGLTVRVDAQRKVRVFNSSGAPVHFLLDVVGYYSATGSQFYPSDPARVLDTRVAFGGAGPLGASGTRTASVASSLPSAGGSEQVPSGAVAIAYNLTVANTGGGGHLRVYPTGSALVPASALNWPASGYTRANGSIVAISPGRQVDIYNGSPSADVLIDTLGYYR